MFEYSKYILEKVSFNNELFIKEFKKAILLLLPNEVVQLKTWVVSFIKKHPHLNDSLLLIQ